jgi:hypothetical protein
MKTDRFSKLVLAVIAISLCVIVFGRPSSAPAVAATSPTAALPYGDIKFVPQGTAGFIAINQRTGDFALYQLSAPNNQWKWEKLGPTGNLAALDTPPTTTP